MSKTSLFLDFSAPPPPVVVEPPRVEMPLPVEPPKALSVAELGRAIKSALGTEFAASVWVEGEVIGARPAASGHMYFSLKDESEDAAIDVAMYKASITPAARALIADGARVRLRGKPSFWAPRGRLQFIAEKAEAIGRGALLEALERLKAKLTAEGLFAAERKRPLPHDPRVIGVVTSAGGAVIHDIRKVAFRRGNARILLAPALVQGAGAAESIARALKMLERVAEVDVIIVGRGGGSSDDLSAFNDEALVRAIVACRVPVVSAVGHEVDMSLADFAADARAATPSQAAEMVVADWHARALALKQTQVRLMRAMRSHVTDRRVQLAAVQRRVGDPRLAISSFQQLLDDRVARIELSIRQRIARDLAVATKLQNRIAAMHPQTVLARERRVVEKLDERAQVLMRTAIDRAMSRAQGLAGRLDAMSPLKVLSRGYAIATRSDGRAVRVDADVTAGDALQIRLHRGVLDAIVTAVRARES